MQVKNYSYFVGEDQVQNRRHSVSDGKNGKAKNGGKSIDARSMASVTDPIATKKAQVRKKAMKIIGDAFAGESKIDDDMTNRREKIRSLTREIGDSTKAISDIEASRAALQDKFGVSSDSQEQKDLELLAKGVETGFSGSDVRLTKEEEEQIAKIKAAGLTEYQQQSLALKKSEESYVNELADARNEIQTENYGEGLNGLLSARHYDMQGIVNGIDYQVYNPATDNKIYCNYDAESFRKKKVNNKLKLQEDLGLTVDKKKYMIGLISRLTDQKGLDLINFVIDRIVDDFTQLVVIGTGEGQYENMFRYYAWKYPDRVSANICYSDDLAHKLYASADAFLMPSRFEPCGLTQLISFRYGTVPIVRETGGLKDTVVPYNEYENTGDGFSFSNYNGEEMLSVINYSKHIFFDKKKQWNQIIDRGMAKDFSWKSSKCRYENLYNYLKGWPV